MQRVLRGLFQDKVLGITILMLLCYNKRGCVGKIRACVCMYIHIYIYSITIVFLIL